VLDWGAGTATVDGQAYPVDVGCRSFYIKDLNMQVRKTHLRIALCMRQQTLHKCVWAKACQVCLLDDACS
jgi:hypothetical protein